MLLGLRLCVVAIILAFVSSPAYAQSYQYDERGRLIRATYSDCSTIRYFYDASGNRTERIVLAGDGSCAGNQAPVVVDDVITMAPGAMGLFNLLGANGGAADSDPNGDVIRLVSVTQGMLPPTPSGALSVQIQSDREHVRIVAPAAEGAYQFSYVIEDALGLTDLGSVIVTVSGASDGPNLELSTHPSWPEMIVAISLILPQTHVCSAICWPMIFMTPAPTSRLSRT
ncbi:MAG: hypothetical protein JKP95_00925 [Oceanicaulis sp.]|nr:hypothetical protein [Oceanicaulis sp.]